MSNINSKYGEEFVSGNLMGPNSLKLIEELSAHLDIRSGMRVLDLGCGKGLTSIFLADNYDVTVYATDLWIPASENYERFKSKKLDGKIIPIHAEARALPYADEYFDLIVSVDAYHYFGTDELYLSEVLSRFAKKGGQIAIAVPGFKEEFTDGIPEYLRQFCAENDLLTFHSNIWWKNLWSKTRCVEVIKSFDLQCSDQAWQDWLSSNNPVSQGDIEFYAAVRENFTTPAVIAKKR